MGVAIPQIISEDKAGGAQIIEGSLRFDRSKTHILKNTFSSAGNRKTWTLSFWHKITDTSNPYNIFTASRGSSTRPTFEVAHNYGSSGNLVLSQYNGSGYDIGVKVDGLYRDIGAWYHFLVVVDTTQSTDSNRVKAYVNGVQRTVTATAGGSVWPSLNADLEIGNNVLHNISANAFGDGNPMNGYVSNFYYINGQALDPSYFGYTDLLTNTWRPKKYTGSILYQFTGTTVANATGAKPILNTTDDVGEVLGSGVASDSSASSLQFAIPGGTSSGINLTDQNPTGRVSGLRNITNGGSLAGNTSIYKYYGGSLYITNGASGSFSTDVWNSIGSGQFTVEMWIYLTSTSMTEGYGSTVISSRGSGDNSNGWYAVGFSGQAGNVPSLYMNLQGGVRHYISDDGTTAAQFPAGRWVHIAQTKDASNVVRTYRNGVKIAQGTSSQALNNVNRGLIGGHDYGNFESYQSFYLNDIRIYNTAKYTGDSFAVPTNSFINRNSFYLPFDGNSPIGQDQSGNGNNWTPVNFGGSNTLEKATGALPILNTDGGGKVAQVGVFGSKVGRTYTVTVPGGIGGGFYLDGVQEPTLSFIRGATYTFDQSAASNSGHPLLFSTTQDGSTYSDGVTTSGTPGSSGAFTKITVPHNSADTLYYKCGNHSGMGASISVTTDEKKSDLYAWKNVLALPLVGIKSDFSNAINSGTSNKAITANNSSFISTESTYYGGSAAFNGVGSGNLAGASYFSAPASSNWNFGTGDATIEAWVNWNGTAEFGARVLYGNGGSGSSEQWGILDTGQLIFMSVTSTTSLGTVPINQWCHIASVRTSGVVRHYINGLYVGGGSNSSSVGQSGNPVYVGTRSDGYHTFSGFMQDFRLYNGVAKYTGNYFNVGTPEPSVLPDTPSGVAYSSNVALVPSTDGAVAFQGTSGPAAATNYLNAGTSSDFTVGTSDNFTFEAFINPTSVSDTSVFGIGSSTTFAYRIISGSPYLYIQTTGGILNTGTIAANKWTHIAVTRNSGTLYSFIDGVLVGSVANTGSFDAATGTGAGTFIGAANLTGVTPPNYSFTGQISNLHWVKGTALYTSNFTPPTAPITSVANTKLLCCKSNSSATAFDVSPGTITANGNAVASNFNPFTVNINTQRGQESGYCTLNPLDNNGGTLSDGNLTKTSSAGASNVSGTISMPSGKWYWEVVISGSASGGVIGIGAGSAMAGTALSNLSKIYGWAPDGNKYANTTASSYAGSYTVGDVIGVSFDADTRQLTFYKNNISQGVAFTVDSGFTYFPQIHLNVMNVICNFGQKPFKFPPPAGFQPLALANTPRPTIVRPDQYVGIITWVGDGTTTNNGIRSFSGLNFGSVPDLVWVKNRTGGFYHVLTDTVRGAGGNKSLSTNDVTIAEGQFGSGNLQSFDYNGFTMIKGSDATASDAIRNYNTNGSNYVAWCWKAGGNKNTFNVNDIGYSTASAAGLTAGTITPTGASVNTKSGFSIIKYTGTGSAATVSHGLQNTPQFLIVKRTDATDRYWMVYHTSTGNTNRLVLNDTFSVAANSAYWNNTSPTSSVFSLGADPGNFSNSTNASGGTYIAYLWAEIPGFSKFGSYSGNSSSDGPVIVTGFKPRWIMIKSSTSTYGWYMYDTARDPYNISGKEILANEASAEVSDSDIDILSNGFKLRRSSLAFNTSSNTFIYAAFAETPSFNLYGGQANAR